VWPAASHAGPPPEIADPAVWPAASHAGPPPEIADPAVWPAASHAGPPPGVSDAAAPGDLVALATLPAAAAPLPRSTPHLAASLTPHREAAPGGNRKRRELTVPTVVAEALERTGINPADIVMAGFRRHSASIAAGQGGRMLARGRSRLRLSISDAEFDGLTHLGQTRGWNRSETVSVILALELLPPKSD
jgi:hypothetical protein